MAEVEMRGVAAEEQATRSWLACSSAVRRLLGNLVVASLYLVFVVGNLKFFLATGSPIGLGVMVCNTTLVVCILTRRSPAAVTRSPRNWLVASLVQVLPLLLRPVEGAPPPLALVSMAGQAAGLVLMAWSLLALNRAIGIVAANRGVKTSGPYRWVRHPLYAGEITFFVSFLLGSFTMGNALLVLLLVAGQIARISEEEALLLADDHYGRYRHVVAYRLIPNVF